MARRVSKKGTTFRTSQEINQEVAQMDLPKMTRQALSKVVSRYASMANKRLRRLEKAGLTDSPAYQRAMKTGGNFSVKGKDKRGLLRELNRVQDFLTLKSSTVKGAKYVNERAKMRMDLKNENLLKDFNDTMSKVMELDSFKTLQANIRNAGTDIEDMVYNEIMNRKRDPEEVLTDMMTWVDEQNQKLEEKYKDFDFYDLL